MKSHSIPIRIYYEDTDAGGVVYHANYLRFGERGRTELLRFLGFENKSIHDQHGVIFVVRTVKADYLKTAHLDDLLNLETAITEIKNASFTMKHIATRHGHKIFEMDVALVCIDQKTHKPQPIPPKVRERFDVFMKEGQ